MAQITRAKKLQLMITVSSSSFSSRFRHCYTLPIFSPFVCISPAAMRIRKNRKFSHLLCSSETEIRGHHRHHPHLCLLNQSPWNANFDFDIQSSLLQFGRDTYLDTNANSNGSHHSVEREAEEAIERITAEEEEEKVDIGEKRMESEFKLENEQRVEVDQSVFNPELIKLVESSNAKHNDSAAGCEGGEKGVAGVRRSQRRTAKKARSLSSNGKDFYYYSEFGPLRFEGKEKI